jgi:hypothetical protein
MKIKYNTVQTLPVLQHLKTYRNFEAQQIFGLRHLKIHRSAVAQ